MSHLDEHFLPILCVLAHRRYCLRSPTLVIPLRRNTDGDRPRIEKSGTAVGWLPRPVQGGYASQLRSPSRGANRWLGGTVPSSDWDSVESALARAYRSFLRTPWINKHNQE